MKVDKSKWQHCDVIMKFLSDRLQKPRATIKFGEDKEVELAPVMAVLPCAISLDMPREIAMASLREYIREGNPDISDNEFSLDNGWNDHMMSGKEKEEDIIFITPKGCTLGPPTDE